MWLFEKDFQEASGTPLFRKSHRTSNKREQEELSFGDAVGTCYTIFKYAKNGLVKFQRPGMFRQCFSNGLTLLGVFRIFDTNDDNLLDFDEYVIAKKCQILMMKRHVPFPEFLSELEEPKFYAMMEYHCKHGTQDSDSESSD